MTGKRGHIELGSHPKSPGVCVHIDGTIFTLIRARLAARYSKEL